MTHAERGALACAGTPPPPPVPRLFSRRAAILLSCGGTLAIILLAIMGVVLTSRAASSAATSAAQRFEGAKSQYTSAAGALSGQAATFRAVVDSAAQSGDLTSLSVAADNFATNLSVFDSTLSALQLPSSVAGDIRAVVAADGTLGDDLSNVPGSADGIQGWTAQVAADYSADSTAHDKLSADLGVSASSFDGAAGSSV